MATKYEIVFKNENSENNIEVEGLEHLEGRKKDFVWYMENGWNYENTENYNEDLPCFNDYGLCFDIIKLEKCPVCGSDNTIPSNYSDNDNEMLCYDCEEIFNDIEYYRYQLSWGGPSEEIRIYQDHVEFVYLNWFCGVSFDITCEEWAKLLVEDFKEIGMINFN